MPKILRSTVHFTYCYFWARGLLLFMVFESRICGRVIGDTRQSLSGTLIAWIAEYGCLPEGYYLHFERLWESTVDNENVFLPFFDRSYAGLYYNGEEEYCYAYPMNDNRKYYS